MAESEVLKHARKQARKLGLRPIRIAMLPGVEVGWPDLFVMGPNRYLLGMETKRAGQDATPMQKERGREMVAYGFAWAKVDTKEEVDFALVNFARMTLGAKPLTRDEVKSFTWKSHGL